MTKERIRILVDTSRDAGWSNGLIYIEPDNLYQTTNNRDYLSETVLKNYDVLTICSNTAVKYTDTELQLIREFVENGGGLLLATNTSRFERDVCEPISELGVNAVASLFGARFILLPEGHGEMDIEASLLRTPPGGHGEIDIEANPLRSYTKKDLRLTNHEIVDGFGIDDLGLIHCGILDIPADSSIFLEHSETGKPVGACLHFGAGRVLLINAQPFQGTHREGNPVSGRFIDWLGINRVSLTTGPQTIPDEIPIDEQVREDGKIKILYTHFTEDRVDTCMAYAKKLHKGMLSKFPEGEQIEWQITLLPSDLIPSATLGYGFGSGGFVGVCVSPLRLAYALGFEASGLLVNKTPFGKAAYVMSDGFQFFFGIWAMKLLGFERETAVMLSNFEQQFRENDEAEALIDIAKLYDKPSRKLIWILKALLEKYGDDLFIRLAEVMSETEGPPDKNMPLTTFSNVDILIYYLSRVVGEDLFPWFEEIGTTVHPIPLVFPNDSAEFVTEVRERLNGITRDTTADTSDRIDAIEGLLRIADESEDGVSKLDAADRYERLIAATKLLKGYDDRTVKVLEALAVETGDDGLVAMAVLMLVRSGRSGETVDRLVEIAPHQDYRYQLEAGSLLKKMNHPAAEQFSHERIVDENGAPVIAMEVEHNRDLHIDAVVEGYRVAVYRAGLYTHHFPYNTHVPGIYIGWLHTVPNYRRKGLSQWILDASMSHELVRRYSSISLITGTDNTAHAIYTSLGFVDGMIKQAFTKTLRHEPVKAVEGFIIRPYLHGDEVAMARVSNAFHADEMNRGLERARRQRTSETWLIYLAEKEGELLGYLQAGCSENGTSAWISEFCLKPQPSENENFLEEVGTALLSELHSKLVKREYEQVSWSSQGEAEKNYVRKLFHNLGYTSTNTNSVWMFRIINLPMLLGELTPLLSKRLNESDAYKNWQGTIGITSSEHRASLIIRDGEIRVSAEVSEGTAIHLSTDDKTLARFILGVFTPYEAHLQSQLHVAPSVNRSVVGLLETLFPARQQVEDRGPQWLPSRLYHV